MSMRTNAVASAGVREWINQNSAVVTVVAVVLVAIALFVVLRGGDPGIKPPDQAYYYVPETKELFAADPDLIPPIDRNGKQAVKANMYGCGDCSEAKRFVGFYEKYSDAGKKRLEELNAQAAASPDESSDAETEMYDISMSHRFISGDGDKWVLAESQQGQALQEAMAEKCSGAKLVFCSP